MLRLNPRPDTPLVWQQLGKSSEIQHFNYTEKSHPAAGCIEFFSPVKKRYLPCRLTISFIQIGANGEVHPFETG
ncbi:MAG: hypothetical protein FMNOHCHN_03296 [Ignavibacteriaceae bacterium]|nr:hypothetical protein [Ignavibacteriaceae bacterium]